MSDRLEQEFTNFRIEYASSMAILTTKMDAVIKAVEPVPQITSKVEVIDEKIKIDRRLIFLNFGVLFGLISKVLYSHLST